MERGKTERVRSAVVYALRVSGLGDSQSVGVLADAGTGYCSREGLRQSGVFTDEVAPGAPDRPGLLAAINLAMDDPAISCLVVSLSSEPAWSPAEVRMISRLLAEIDVRTKVLVDGSPLPDLPRCWIDDLLETQESPAQWKRLKRSRIEYLRVQGRDRLSRSLPNGYRATFQKSGKRFIHQDPVPSAIVTAAFQLFARKDNSVEDVLNYLNDMPGIKEFGHGYVDGKDLIAILRNRNYLGEVMISWQEWIPARFPALIDRKTFMLAGKRLRKILSAASAEEDETSE